MKRFLILILAVFAMAGCASREYKEAQLRYYSAQAEAMKADAKQKEQPLVHIEMGDDGKLKTLVVGRQGGGQTAPTMVMPQDPNVEIVRSITSGIVTVGSIVAGGRAAGNLVEAVGSVVGKVSGPTTTTTTNTTTTTTTDDHSVTTTTDSHDVDSTHTPTVVTQPAPLVVNPVVVTP